MKALLVLEDGFALEGRSVNGACDCGGEVCCQIPGAIRCCFDEELVLSGDKKRLYVTLGQFSIIRLERDVQLVIPVVDYSIPTKECCDALGGCAEDPCEVFSRIPFPANQFASNGCDRQCDKENCYTTTANN